MDEESGSEPMAISAPAAARATAVAWPMPVAPPVTQATRPARNFSATPASATCLAFRRHGEALGESRPEGAEVVADGDQCGAVTAGEIEDLRARRRNRPGLAAGGRDTSHLGEIGQI